MIIVLMRAINFFFQVLIYLIIGRAIMSWFVRPGDRNFYKIYMMILQVTEPLLAPCRKLLGRFGMRGTIDFSPILAIIGLTLINGIILKLLRIFIF